MKRTPIARRTPLARGSRTLCRSTLARGTRKRPGPSAAGKRFNAWACEETRKRADNRCERCFVWGERWTLECAHLVPLQRGGNRNDPLDPRNHPPLRAMLCGDDPRTGRLGCHGAMDVRHEFTPADLGRDVEALFEQARESVWKHAGRFEEQATRARPTPRRRRAA